MKNNNLIYETRIHKSWKKPYNKVMNKFKKAVRERMITTLQNHPQSLPLRKGLRLYKLPQAHRVLIQIYETPKKETLIICIGDHDTYERFLRELRKGD